MKKSTIFIFISVAIIFFIGGFYFFNKISDRKNDDSDNKDLILVNFPKPNDLVKSPFLIKGQARGNWYFEASFPAQLYDQNSKLLGQKPIMAKGEWMTENFVPFEEQFEFTNPTVDRGHLVLKNDNPSGLPELASELRIPVRFEPSPAAKIKLFFNNSKMDPEFSCNKVFGVEREVPATQAVARAAIEELLQGITFVEKEQGYSTSINSNVKIQKLTIENGVAKIDFDEQLEFQVGGSCRVSAIRAQIIETLKQFSTIKSVIISINNQTEGILQP